jgi:CBS domain-containing protein
MSSDRNGEGFEGYKKLEQVAAGLKSGQKISVTVQDLLRWFGTQRRCVHINRIIREALLNNDLRTEPYFSESSIDLDDEIEFHEGNLQIKRAETSMRNQMLFEFFSIRLATWIDQNPGVTEGEIRAKAEALEKLGIGDLSSDESADIVPLFDRISQIPDPDDEDTEAYKRLRRIAVRLESGETVEPIQVRVLLRWFGTDHRRLHINCMIREALRRNNLRTDPDFSEQFLDGAVEFRQGYRPNKIDVAMLNELWLELFLDRLAAWRDENPSATGEEIKAKAEALQKLGFEELPGVESAQVIPFPARQGLPNIGAPSTVVETVTGQPPPAETDLPPVIDPTSRVGELPSANVPPPALKPTETITDALYIMMRDRLSQLPVMAGERTVKGVVRWHAIATRRNQDVRDAVVSKCMEPAQIVDADLPLFEVIDEITKHDYALIRDRTRKIVGMVTSNDLTMALRKLSEPYFLLREIENHLRALITRGGFSVAEMRKVRAPSDRGRPVNGVVDLTLGECIDLIDLPESWSRLMIWPPKAQFIQDLKEINRIRNHIMHFRSTDICQQKLETLRRSVKFLRTVQSPHPGKSS